MDPLKKSRLEGGALPVLYLASASPRRRELLELAGIPFVCEPSRCEETARGTPQDVVEENARRKGEWVYARHPEAVVLSADTVVYLPGEDRILGKPADALDAADMLRALSGRENRVYTGVAVLGPKGCTVKCECASVWFDALSEADIAAYVATGEPMDKAGAYALQGRGGTYISRVEGSVSCVIGLPMTLVRAMLRPYLGCP